MNAQEFGKITIIIIAILVIAATLLVFFSAKNIYALKKSLFSSASRPANTKVVPVLLRFYLSFASLFCLCLIVWSFFNISLAEQWLGGITPYDRVGPIVGISFLAALIPLTISAAYLFLPQKLRS